MNLTEIKEWAGRLLVVGFSGESLPESMQRALAEGRVGGVILFARNIVEPHQVLSLNVEVHRAASERGIPFVCVDQEGGRVARLREPLTVVPPMWTVGATGDPRNAERVGRILGAELAPLGFNVDFAPCVDLWTNPENRVIGDRAFGADPEEVARFGAALLEGLAASGVIGCAKHFPGHGDTVADSHLELPIVERSVDELRRREWVPFARLAERAQMIMTAHLLVPAVDPELPATVSRRWIHGILRERLGYDGVVVSDDMEMRAIADRYEPDEFVELALEATVDLFLICHTRERWEAAFDHLVVRAERSERVRARLEEAAARVTALRKRLKRWKPPRELPPLLGRAEHRETITRIRELGERALNREEDGEHARTTDDTGADPTDWRRHVPDAGSSAQKDRSTSHEQSRDELLAGLADGTLDDPSAIPGVAILGSDGRFEIPDGSDAE